MGRIFSRQTGKGNTVIFIHGFPMDHSIWDGLAEELSKEYHVVTPDLPGFGKSEILPAPFSIDTVAETLLAWIEENNFKNSVLVGHSLGGYVSLAMVDKKPGLFNALCLFHSTAFADDAEKKESRTKVVRFIDEKGVLAFTSNFVQPLFSDSKHPGIKKIKSISTKAGAEAVKGYTVAMRDRPDRTHVLKDFSKPILFIAGEHDSAIPVESITQQSMQKNTKMILLKNTGHMGMIESKGETLTAVKSFLEEIYVFKEQR